MNVQEYRQLLLRYRQQLVGAISVEYGLHNYLISSGVLSLDQWSTIKEKPHRTQIEDILDIVYKKQCPDSFEQFCAALRKNNQGHVVRNYLNTSRLADIPFEKHTKVSPCEKPPPWNGATHEFIRSPRGASMQEVKQCPSKQAMQAPNIPNTIYAVDARPERGPQVSTQEHVPPQNNKRTEVTVGYPGYRSPPELSTGIHSLPSPTGERDIEIVPGYHGYHSHTEGHIESEVHGLEPLASRVEAVLRLGPTGSTGDTVIMDGDYYDINPQQPGYVHIINNRNFSQTATTPTEERFGSETDVTNLYSLFARKKFKVNVTSDVTENEMMELVSRIVNDPSLRFASSFILVLMSHGEQGSLVTADGKEIHFDEILDRFKGIACPALIGKPKMFIIQACRGRENNLGVDVRKDGPSVVRPTVVRDACPRESIPDNADCLFAYSTTLGHWSYRNIEEGSWFITTLCKVFELEKEDVLHMLVQVNREVSLMGSSAEKQMPMPALTLRKKWYLTGHNQ